MPKKPIPKQDLKSEIDLFKQHLNLPLPDPNVERKPFYTFYSVDDAGIVIWVFKDTIRDTINSAILASRANRVKDHINQGMGMIREGVAVTKDLLGIIRISRVDKSVSLVDWVRTKDSPVIIVDEGSDMIMLQYEVDNHTIAEDGVKYRTFKYLFWSTGLGISCGHDPQKPVEVMLYHTARNVRPGAIKQLQAVNQLLQGNLGIGNRYLNEANDASTDGPTALS